MAVKSAESPSGDFVKQSDLEGELLAIEPKEVRTESTAHGEWRFVNATVHVVNASESHTDIRLSGAVLVRQLEDNIGDTVVGTLSKGEASAGKSAPWLLKPADPTEVAAAESYLAETAEAPF